MNTVERQITHGPGGRILTNTGVWSPDSEWIVYDTRSDPEGAVFDGSSIEMVNIHSGEVKVLYRSTNGAHCGVVTFNPVRSRIVFIQGPEHPTPVWGYCAFHRRGVMVDIADADTESGWYARESISSPLVPKGERDAVPPEGGTPNHLQATLHNLDARDLTPPFTAGALRGGTHVHVWDAAGEWVSFTYEDAVLARYQESAADHDLNLRNVGVSVPFGSVRVPKDNPRNHDGEYFTVLVTHTTAQPQPGSDEIKKAFEEAWVGTNGYVRTDGTRQRRALAFQGQVVTSRGETISEVFLVDLPEDVTVPGKGPLAGTETRMPYPPKGTQQRRLTHTADRNFPGLQGPRHWLRSSPDGSQIAFLMKDDNGVVQLWTISPNGGEPVPVTHNPWSIASAFTWSPNGRWLAHVMDQSVCLTEIATGQTIRLTLRQDEANAPRPEACVFSPDGTKIAYIRRVPADGQGSNQIFIVTGFLK